jgi:hypothetical protein
VPKKWDDLNKKEKKCYRPVRRVQQLKKDEPYSDIIDEHTAKPLSAFLRALGNGECPKLMFDFLQAPFLTARTAGVPYAAALMLGSGDWEEIRAALMAENDRSQRLVGQITGSLGPVWVKAR